MIRSFIRGCVKLFLTLVLLMAVYALLSGLLQVLVGVFYGALFVVSGMVLFLLVVYFWPRG